MKLKTTITDSKYGKFVKALEDGNYDGDNFYGAIFFGNTCIELMYDPEWDDPDDSRPSGCSTVANVYLANHGDGSYGELPDGTPYDCIHAVCMDEIPGWEALKATDAVDFIDVLVKTALSGVDGAYRGKMLADVPFPAWKDIGNAITVGKVEGGAA